jgi:subtilisin family serine protease
LRVGSANRRAVSARRLGEALVALVALVPLLAGAEGALALPQSQAPGTQELLVGFVGGSSPAERAATHALAGADVVRSLRDVGEIGVDLVRVPAVAAPAVRALYRQDPSVLYAEPNSIRKASVQPNDPFAVPSYQWGLSTVGATASPGAWDVTTGADSTVVAVVDTGVDISHPDLAANIWRNPGEVAGNGLDDDGNGYVDDVNGWDFAHRDGSLHDPGDTCDGTEPADDHGTHVSGIIGGVGNNNRGVAGMAWRVRIMPLKFLTQCGEGEDADAVEAIMYAIRMGADVINLSWGGPAPAESLRQALLAARDAGVVVAVAAGNDHKNIAVEADYPASYGLPNEVVVAASTETDARAVFSNYGGPTALAAPGDHILSTTVGNTYSYMSGTSMATPFVSGALALLRTQYPQASVAELRDRLLGSVDVVGALAGLTSTSGRLNANAALRNPLAAVPTVTSPNGGETLLPGLQAGVTWKSNVPGGGTVPSYRIEQTTNPIASRTVSTSFDTGVPDWLVQPPNSDAGWVASGSILRSGLGRVQNDSASWASATVDLSVPGRVRFAYRVSSENCESFAMPVCGDYFRFLVDGVEKVHAAGETGWQQAAYSIPAGRHVLSWAYKKDVVCPVPTGDPDCAPVQSVEDAAFIDTLAIEGVDDAQWSFLGATPGGVSSFAWTPSAPAAGAKVRVCVNTGTACESALSDTGDGTFSISSIKVVPTGGSTQVAEGGAADTVSVVLLAAPSASVTVAAVGDGQVSVSPSLLTFTTGDWAVPQTLTITAVDDPLAEASPHTGTVLLSASSADPAFAGASLGLVTASVVDNDLLGPLGTFSGTGSSGYWMVASDGGIFAFGDAGFQGSTGAIHLNQPIVTMAPTPTGQGYWMVASDGGIFAFGDARFYGSTGGFKLAKPIVGMAPTPSGLGYWLVASDGGIFAFGDARFHGSTGGIKLAQPIVGMTPTPTGRGYWMVASDGGIFAFGDATFQGSTGGIKLAQPIVGMATTPNGGGYWLVARDGGMFAYGDARFFGSTGGTRLNRPIVSMAPTSTGAGYWLVASDGGIFAFGDAGFLGSTGGTALNRPIVALAVRPPGRS